MVCCSASRCVNNRSPGRAASVTDTIAKPQSERKGRCRASSRDMDKLLKHPDVWILCQNGRHHPKAPHMEEESEARRMKRKMGGFEQVRFYPI